MAEIERGLLSLGALKKRMDGEIEQRKNEFLRDLGLYGACDCCGRQSEIGQDHDHANGLNRGKLCKGCNWGLGNFKDDILRLEQAIEYLKTWQKFHTHLSPQLRSEYRFIHTRKNRKSVAVGTLVICPICKREFKTKRTTHKFCSARCNWEDWNRKHPRLKAGS